MSTLQNTSILDSLGLAQTGASKTDRNKLNQEQFLKLMVTQLKNQDPTKPMENGQFLGQIAQFSTVTGIQDLQSSFGQLAGALQSNQALQASGLVGRTVLVPGSIGLLGTSLNGAVDLPASTTDLAVNVYNATGQLVRRLELGPQTSGLARFSWDGIGDKGQQLPPGVYQLKAEARIDGRTAGVDTLVSSTVQSVTLGKEGQGLSVNLPGVGSVPLTSVKQIL